MVARWDHQYDDATFYYETHPNPIFLNHLKKPNNTHLYILIL